MASRDSSSYRDRHGGSWDKRKRSTRAAEDAAASERPIEIELADLRMLAASQQEQIDRLHAPIDSNVSGVFNMREQAQREQLAIAIWTADFRNSMETLKAANPELLEVLRAQLANTTTATSISVIRKENQLDGILLNVVRGQSTLDVCVGPLVVLERSLSAGGTWRHHGNAFSRVNSSEPSYRLRVTRPEPNTNHSYHSEILADSLLAIQQYALAQRIHTHAEVACVASLPDDTGPGGTGWMISGRRHSIRRFQLPCGFLCISTYRHCQ